jgi:hypothetical protein
MAAQISARATRPETSSCVMRRTDSSRDSVSRCRHRSTRDSFVGEAKRRQSLGSEATRATQQITRVHGQSLRLLLSTNCTTESKTAFSIALRPYL